ncbi:MAG: hypothetical protein PHQ23_08490 [Candidatus Wallbacteria bacterium]|nr:hypothetical protein [Candidatus Wallbacteria bacterium]
MASANEKSNHTLIDTLMKNMLGEKRKKCPKCGKGAMPHWQFCPEDGEPL